MPFQLGTKSLSELKGVHPKLVETVKIAIGLSEIDFSVHDGLRTQREQDAYLASGASKRKHSEHQTQADGLGHAVDLVPYVNGKLKWEWDLIYPIAVAMYVASLQTHTTLRWGGVWDKLMMAYIPPNCKSMKDAVVIGGALRKEVAAYCVRHPGPDFLDGPHYELA